MGVGFRPEMVGCKGLFCCDCDDDDGDGNLMLVGSSDKSKVTDFVAGLAGLSSSFPSEVGFLSPERVKSSVVCRTRL